MAESQILLTGKKVTVPTELTISNQYQSPVFVSVYAIPPDTNSNGKIGLFHSTNELKNNYLVASATLPKFGGNITLKYQGTEDAQTKEWYLVYYAIYLPFVYSEERFCKLKTRNSYIIIPDDATTIRNETILDSVNKLFAYNPPVCKQAQAREFNV